MRNQTSSAHRNPTWRKPSALAAAPLLALVLAGATPARAQSTGNDWQYEAAIYAWLPGLSGDTSFSPDGGGPSIDLSTGDVISALKFALMGNLQARKGQWGVWTDLLYADIGGSRKGSRDFSIGGQPLPAGVSADLGLDLKAWIWTLAGTYQLKNDSAVSLDMLFGTRMLDMTNTLDWDIAGSGGVLPPQSGSKALSQTNWDAVVGLKGRANLGSEGRWFVPFYLDVGTGESQFTWQANAGVGYRFDWGALVASWRYLGYEFKSGGHVDSLNFSGPLVGVMFKF